MSSEAKENKGLVIITRLLHGIARDLGEVSSVFFLGAILTGLASAEFSVNYKACLGDNYICLMCLVME